MLNQGPALKTIYYSHQTLVYGYSHAHLTVFFLNEINLNI